MQEATRLGYKACLKEEIPVGAIIVKNNKIIARAYNKREKTQLATNHAEIIAIQKACKKLKSWRLDDCDLYATLEPCPMCAGAIMNARIKNVFFAVTDIDNGGHSRFNIFNSCLNHTAVCKKMEDFEYENKKLSQDFFKNRRNKQRKNKKNEKI